MEIGYGQIDDDDAIDAFDYVTDNLAVPYRDLSVAQSLNGIAALDDGFTQFAYLPIRPRLFRR